MEIKKSGLSCQLKRTWPLLEIYTVGWSSTWALVGDLAPECSTYTFHYQLYSSYTFNENLANESFKCHSFFNMVAEAPWGSPAHSTGSSELLVLCCTHYQVALNFWSYAAHPTGSSELLVLCSFSVGTHKANPVTSKSTHKAYWIYFFLRYIQLTGKGVKKRLNTTVSNNLGMLKRN